MSSNRADYVYADSLTSLNRITIPYEPFEKQARFHSSPAPYRLFGGAAGPGKTEAIMWEGITKCLLAPGTSGVLFRRTFPELEMSLIRRFLGKTPNALYNYNASQHIARFFNGSLLQFAYCANEKDVYRYQSAEYDFIGVDELTHFDEFFFTYIISRLRTVKEKVKPSFFAATNPGNIGHRWVKARWIDKNCEEPGYKADDYEFIPARVHDNPILLDRDPEYLKRLENLPEIQRRALLEGDFDIFAGQFFDNWRRDIHIVPRDFPIEPWWNRFGGYDHGHNHPYVFGAYAVDGDGNVYKYAEAGDRNRKPDQIYDEIVLLCPEFKDRRWPIFAGHDLWSRGRDGSPEIVERFSSLGLAMVKAGIDRKHGADQLRNYLDWRRSAETKEFTKKPKLFIKENCWRTIRQLPAMIYDEKDPEDVLKVNATESDPWAGDDAYDETRYAMMSRPRISTKVNEPYEWGTYGWLIGKHKDEQRIAANRK